MMDHTNEHDNESQSDLDMLFEMVLERNRKFDEAMFRDLETKRSVERTLRQEEEARLRDLNRLGSYDQAAAVARENYRKSALRRDAEKKRREAERDFEDLY